MEKKRKPILSNIILIIAIAVFCISGYKLYGIFSEYRKGEKEYDKLNDEIVSVEVQEESEIPEDPEDSEETEQEKKVVVINFEELLRMNPDTVGWLRFDEPAQISYPLVRAEDNDKYLHRTFEGKKNSAGAIFVDADNAGDFSDRNTFIHGHNMKNGSMFGQLRKYKSQSFCKENPYFYIHTPDGKVSTYQVFAVCVVKDTSESYNKWYNTDQEFLDYIEHIQGIAKYPVDVEVKVDSKIVSLSTCTNVTDDERLIVHGVKMLEVVR